MKNILSLLSLVTLVLFSVIACTNSGSDTNTSKTFTISEFSSMRIELIGEVIYEQSDSSYLSASGSSTLVEDLRVSNTNGELTIELKNKRNYSGRKRQLVIRVGSPDLQSIDYQGVGILNLKNKFHGDKLSISNKGVGQIIIDDCQVGTFDLYTKSVGSVEVKGSANEVFIQSEGIGNIDCSKFKSKRAKLISKGASNLSVYAQESIDISIKGIGNVNYYGNPPEVKTDISGLGKANNKGS